MASKEWQLKAVAEVAEDFPTAYEGLELESVCLFVGKDYIEGIQAGLVYVGNRVFAVSYGEFGFEYEEVDSAEIAMMNKKLGPFTVQRWFKRNKEGWWEYETKESDQPEKM